MPRFFAPKENIKENLIYIDGQEAKHVLSVMRLKENDKVVVFDGTGKEYAGFIKKAGTNSLTVEVIQTKMPNPEILPEITLVQAIPKKQKMDYIIEKATELGVSAVIPVITERVIVKLDDKKAGVRVERWKKIALSASKQCGRPDIPKIENIQKFYDVIDRVNDYDLALTAYLGDETVSLKEALSGFETGKIILFIGPEGDFTPDEINMAKDTPAKFISLGKRVLKSDTAALYTLSVLAHRLSL